MDKFYAALYGQSVGDIIFSDQAMLAQTFAITQAIAVLRNVGLGQSFGGQVAELDQDITNPSSQKIFLHGPGQTNRHENDTRAIKELAIG